MKSYSDLPFTTDNHEYFISWDKQTALIKVVYTNDAEAISNPVTKNEFKEMIMTATTKEVKNIIYDIKHSIEVHTHTMKEIEKYYNVKITIKN